MVGTSFAVTRTCSFGPLLIAYDERVLEPRQWTYLQSEWAAELAAAATPGPLLELCAGAGQIGLAAAVAARRDLVQVEADPVAATYARRNAIRAGWGDRTDVRTVRMADALEADERYPLVLADPPYLRTADVARWPADPRGAIDGGTDGLTLVRAAIDVAAAHLVPGGQLLLQVAGPGQAEALDCCGLVRDDLRVIDGERAIVLLRRP